MVHRNRSFRFDGLQKEEQQLLLALYDPHQPEVLITHCIEKSILAVVTVIGYDWTLSYVAHYCI